MTYFAAEGLIKGHCSFPEAFPVIGLDLQQPLHDAEHFTCNEVAGALGVPLTGQGKVTLTPSGNVNVNCHNVVPGGN